jgi:dTDP-4-amino-4,6-dideoxygalactose transaminase
MKKIPFNVPLQVGNEKKYLAECMKSGKLSGDGPFTKKCSQWFEATTGAKKVLLTTSCTHALEMAAILLNISADDEVIMPSYTFVSTANAFVLRGAKIVFVDVRPDTMNIDETKIEQAITEKTKAIVPVHYAGVACEMDTIMALAEKYNLYVVEDAAQGMMSTYKGKVLGTIGHFGTYSFHETKNYTSGEGGLLLINDKQYIQRAEIIREKGTNRSQFLRGVVDKYRWVDMGSSYLLSDLNAAYLFAQLEKAEEVNRHRLILWSEYYKQLKRVEQIELPTIPKGVAHNGHIFYIKLKNDRQRQDLIYHLASLEIQSVFHYIPLHESQKCATYYEFSGEDTFTTKESERLLRLPMYYRLTKEDVKHICHEIKVFFHA